MDSALTPITVNVSGAIDSALTPITVSVSGTQYKLIARVAIEKYGFKVVYKDEHCNECDVIWVDRGITFDRFAKMKPHQKISNVIGVNQVCRKNLLWKNYKIMRRTFMIDYDFHPQTWVLPGEFTDFRYHSERERGWYIVKPEWGSQGRGISLVNKIDKIPIGERCIVQQYIENPFLMGGLKFDLRVYVLITGTDPLRLFIYEEGLARFSTREYSQPNCENVKQMFIHLTNYAINKNNPDFVKNKNASVDNVGHKRSLTALFNSLEKTGVDIDQIWTDIQDIVIKTMVLADPHMKYNYKRYQNYELYNGIAFQILGFDILLDRNLKSWLIEVNQSPSFKDDSPLDTKIKYSLISDTFDLLDLSSNNRKRGQQARANLHNRFYGSAQYKEELAKEKSKISSYRDAFDDRHRGGFTKIYPADDANDYAPFFERSQKLFQLQHFGREKSREGERKNVTQIRQAFISQPQTRAISRNASLRLSLYNPANYPPRKVPHMSVSLLHEPKTPSLQKRVMTVKPKLINAPEPQNLKRSTNSSPLSGSFIKPRQLSEMLVPQVPVKKAYQFRARLKTPSKPLIVKKERRKLNLFHSSASLDET